MKGVELPINVLIIIAIAIIVLIALIAMFYPAFTQGSDTVNSDMAKSTACQIMIERNCDLEPNQILINNFDADKDGGRDAGTTWDSSSQCTVDGTGDDNLMSLCACYYSVGTPEGCKRLCGC